MKVVLVALVYMLILLRSMDSEMLVQWYIELKPLIDQAYGELGYPDQDFTDKLHNAITKVLDMEIPKTQPELERTKCYV